MEIAFERLWMRKERPMSERETVDSYRSGLGKHGVSLVLLCQVVV
jgi:hypothetical protein